MENKIQNYAWGSSSSIHELFGFENESQQPQAEVWMGTHPKGCSMVIFDQHPMPLSKLINSNKSAVQTHYNYSTLIIPVCPTVFLTAI